MFVAARVSRYCGAAYTSKGGVSCFNATFYSQLNLILFQQLQAQVCSDETAMTGGIVQRGDSFDC
jgi:hypothetical protein